MSDQLDNGQSQNFEISFSNSNLNRSKSVAFSAGIWYLNKHNFVASSAQTIQLMLQISARYISNFVNKSHPDHLNGKVLHEQMNQTTKNTSKFMLNYFKSTLWQGKMWPTLN